MSDLTPADSEALTAWWNSEWPRDESDVRDVLAAVVVDIAGRHVAAALTEAADAIEPGGTGGSGKLPDHWSAIERLSFLSGMDRAARIVRAAIPTDSATASSALAPG